MHMVTRARFLPVRFSNKNSGIYDLGITDAGAGLSPVHAVKASAVRITIKLSFRMLVISINHLVINFLSIKHSFRYT